MINTHVNKTQKNKSKSVSRVKSQMQSGGESTFQFVDNRPEAVAQRKLQELANNNPQVSQPMALQDTANNGPQVKQFKTYQEIADSHPIDSFKPVIQRFAVYRSGGKTLKNMTPKAKDFETGLSTYEDPTKIGSAPIKITNAQVIETDSLPNTLEAVRDGDGKGDSHVSIRPTSDEDNSKLNAWVDNITSPLSKATLDAVGSTWKAPKPKKEK